MAKEFFKKLVLGVAISMTSVAILAGFSRLGTWLRPDEETSEAVCTHTKIVEVSGKAPTCTEPGLTDGIFCGVCHGVIKAQEVIDALGHVHVIVPGYPATCVETGLTDGKVCGVCDAVLVTQSIIPRSFNHAYENGVCLVCGKEEPVDTSTYVEVEASIDELVVGNWYRIYNNSQFSLSADLVNSMYEPTVNLYCYFDYSSGFISYAGQSGGWVVDGMDYVITDEYIDVWLLPGVYTLDGDSNVYFEITSETTITSLYGNIYKLVPPSK